ncbi:hypothetical protein K469DRAFT_730625 [Zopfia rhizophila CBS 207.26]|uniref:MFS general substrate transporter n=1 Tax=Zopfia rhizophila CBS 207.26 TaxID=1314779 RepID=A0A6A6DMC0_9PEZI|nr:hypothetical protein K469DRAFT_730625 [Zopfia rhizophila CBS 207.26]
MAESLPRKETYEGAQNQRACVHHVSALSAEANALSCFVFLQPLSETVLSPVETQISLGLHIEHAYDWLLVNSLILIGVGLSPFMLASLSEVHGRRPIILIGSTIFVIWNIGRGAASFGACVADTIARGVLGDLESAEERGESTEPRLEHARRKNMKNQIQLAKESEEEYDKIKPFLGLMRTNLRRPFPMLGIQLIVQFLATYMALLYSTMFLFLFMYPRMWSQQYGQSVRIAGHLNDRIYDRLKARNNNVGRPKIMFRCAASAISTNLVLQSLSAAFFPFFAPYMLNSLGFGLGATV